MKTIQHLILICVFAMVSVTWAQLEVKNSSNNVVMRITQAGDVAIGLNHTPSSKLDVDGTATMTGFRLGTSATASYVLTANAQGYGTWQPANTGSDNQRLLVQTAGADEAVIDIERSASDVTLIGTSPITITPNAGARTITIGMTEVDPQVGNNTTSYVPRWNGSALVTGQIFDNTTRLGIATSDPQSQLHIADSKSGDMPYLDMTVVSNIYAYDATISNTSTANVSSIEGVVSSTGTNDLSTGSRIAVHGVLINKNTAEPGNIIASGSIAYESNVHDWIAAHMANIYDFGAPIPSNHSTFTMKCDNQRTTVRDFCVFATGAKNYFEGNVGIGTTLPAHKIQIGDGPSLGAYCDGGAWIDGSSRSIKKNIQELSGDQALEVLTHLKPVMYEYTINPDGDLNLGFIAEDVPELVATKDRKGLSPMDFVAILTRVVQNQQEMLKAYEARLRSLEAIEKPIK
ncbi:tail fiber domain-containing protein [candidate division KSB1 bacterium]|nr:tail fiber domain-containing protein [candidate division KSB1 bacterium]